MIINSCSFSALQLHALLCNAFKCSISKTSICIPLFSLLITQANAQDNDTVNDIKKQVPTNEAAIKDHTEFHSKSLTTDAKTKSSAILKRIKSLQKRQAEYLKNVAAGLIIPNNDLVDQWAQIQKSLFSVRRNITELNALQDHDPSRSPLETEILSELQPIGSYLTNASHPKFQPREFDSSQQAEIIRIQNAITNMSFGDRSKAKPVKRIHPSFFYTLIHLPTPLSFKSQPNETLYLTADTGGVFSNELPYIELKADQKGIAKTTWLSIGEAIGICYITIYSQSAIESQQFTLQVVSPHLIPLEGLPAPDSKLLPTSKTLKPSELKKRLPSNK